MFDRLVWFEYSNHSPYHVQNAWMVGVWFKYWNYSPYHNTTCMIDWCGSNIQIIHHIIYSFSDTLVCFEYSNNSHSIFDTFNITMLSKILSFYLFVHESEELLSLLLLHVHDVVLLRLPSHQRCVGYQKINRASLKALRN